MSSSPAKVNQNASPLSLFDQVSESCPRHMEVRKAIKDHRAGRRLPVAFRGQFDDYDEPGDTATTSPLAIAWRSEPKSANDGGSTTPSERLFR
jgi:hypothetical protein